MGRHTFDPVPIQLDKYQNMLGPGRHDDRVMFGTSRPVPTAHDRDLGGYKCPALCSHIPNTRWPTPLAHALEPSRLPFF